MLPLVHKLSSGQDHGLTLALKHSSYHVSPWPNFRITSIDRAQEAVPRVLRVLWGLLGDDLFSDDMSRRFLVHQLVARIPLQLHLKIVPMLNWYFAGVDLCAAVPAAQELFLDNHGLGAALATRWADQRDPSLYASICRQKHRDIAAFVGFPRSETSCRLSEEIIAHALGPASVGAARPACP
jgi:hypothetical protein